jgi:hypothetical protein
MNIQSRAPRWPGSVVKMGIVVWINWSGLAASAAPLTQRVNPAAATQAAFTRRIDDYMQLHRKLEAMLPPLPKEATPQQIDQNQRALAELIVKARANARRGDFFTPDMEDLIHRLFTDVFSGRAGRDAKNYIHDEPHPVTPEINKRYPDTIPLATMPLRVLAELPKLPDELEYRFVDRHLILMDVHAHIILDYVLNAIPATTAPAPSRRRR